MTTTLLIIITGLATALLAFAFGFPQWFRVRRTGSVAGISLASVTNSLVSDAAWLLYGLSIKDVWVTTTSLVGLPAIIATFIAVQRRSDDRAGMWVPLAYAGLLTATALTTPWLPALFPTVLGGSILWFVVPAATTAWRSADVTGIARGTWWLLVLDGLVAGAYGTLANVSAYLVYAAIALVGATVVLARLHWRWVPACGECAPIAGCSCPA
jgi:uncharacterized protein with PQ loop repeat